MVSTQALAKARWYAYRLSAMSLPEMVHRAAELWQRRTGKALAGWAQFTLPPGPLPVLAYDDAALSRLVALASTDWQRHFDDAVTGRWRFLGKEWPGVVDSPWHLDPVTGKYWPSESYCFDIPYRHRDDLGDIKYVWELNRLQFLPPIAALARLRDDGAARRFCIETIESWIDANPPFMGVNWISGIEIALRAVSLILTVSLLGPEVFSEASAVRLRMALNAHAVWLARYPSRHSSANNHLISEAAGLFLVGTLMPDLPLAAAYQAEGFEVLCAEAEKQILEDGVGAEQSPTYTAFTLEWYLLAMKAGEGAGIAFPPHARHRVAAAARHLRWITDERGHQPRIGDDDEGRVIVSQTGGENDYVSSVLGCLAGALNAPELVPPDVKPHLRHLFVGGPPGSVSEGPSGCQFFDAGGYTVFRQEMAGRRSLLVFDHGPLGYLSIAAHGHADALAIWLHLDGIPVFVDAGTYLYHSGGDWRDRFRGTSAHNTLTLAGENQSSIAGAFNWSHKARAKRTPMRQTADSSCSVAQHDGYKHRFGVLHQRTISLEAPDGYAVEDRLLGHLKVPDASASIRYLVHPDLDVTHQAEHRARISKHGADIAEIETMRLTAAGPYPEPIALEEAIFSRRFGEREPAVALAINVDATAMMTAPIRTTIRVLSGVTRR